MADRDNEKAVRRVIEQALSDKLGMDVNFLEIDTHIDDDNGMMTIEWVVKQQ